jgi:putative addiction module killer protein
MWQIRHYLTPRGIDPFQVWLDGLRDLKGRIAILRRVDRLAAGNSGDHQVVGEGVSELRIDFGPGYRVYDARHGKTVVLLLCGGSKRSQAGDIEKAVRYWDESQRR